MKNQEHEKLRGTSASVGNVPAMPEQNPARAGEVSAVQHSSREHSRISPSKLKSLEICPGFLDDPNREVHAITLQGTKCHECLDSGDDSKLTDEERGWVKMCRNYVADIKGLRFNEERLEILDGIWGYADLIINDVRQRTLHLVDYKFGMSAQEDAETNPAAQAYVLGMFERWTNHDTIHVHYLYPRREEISKHTYTRKDVPVIRLRIQTIVERVARYNNWATMTLHGDFHHPEKLAEVAQLANPVPDNCQWCSRKSTCIALHKMVLPLATRYAGKHDISLTQPDFSVVKSPEQWSSLLAYAPVLEQMADSIKRRALEFREQNGVEIPGYEMRQRKGTAKIVNADLAYGVAERYLDHSEIMRCVDISVPQLKKAVEEKAPKGQKSKQAALLEGELRDAGVLEVGKESYYLARSRA